MRDVISEKWLQPGPIANIHIALPMSAGRVILKVLTDAVLVLRAAFGGWGRGRGVWGGRSWSHEGRHGAWDERMREFHDELHRRESAGGSTGSGSTGSGSTGSSPTDQHRA